MILVDTSVVVAFYVPESGSRTAQDLYDGDEPLAICPLTEVEFASAISKLYRMKAIRRADAGRILDQFGDHIAQQLYSFCPMTQDVYRQAREWIASLKTPLRSLDAIQLAAAHVQGIPFATADKTLAKTGRQLGAKINEI